MSAKKKPYQLGEGGRKCDAKLRVIANGAQDVNLVRAERCDALTVSSRVSLADQPTSCEVRETTPRGKTPPLGKIASPPTEVLANVFISTIVPITLPSKLVKETGRVGTTATATVRLSDLKKIAADKSVRHVALGQGLRDPNPVISSSTPAAPRVADRAVGHANLHKEGAGVLVGIIDVQGFDFSHPDFLDGNKTRFEAIWDQGARPDGSMTGFDYGRVITKDQMNAAIAAAPKVGAPAFELEPQSQMVPGSHATHVASIAAGNLGVARKAKIAAVLVSLGPDDYDRRRSFYDSTRLAHAVSWLLEQGAQANMPVSINVSLGTNGHAHDSSAPVNRWIDALLAIPGRSVCVAAGNAGQERAETPDDVGFVMGRIHTQGQVAAANLNSDIEWVVAGSVEQIDPALGGDTGISAARDYSENELEIWFSPQDKMAVSVREPGGKWHGPVSPREFIENRKLADGTLLSIFNELYHPSNGANYIGVFLSPNMRARPIIGVKSGQWVVRLHGVEIRDGRYDGWIERDDPERRQPDPEKPRVWAFPSFFTERSNVDNSSISTLACGNRVIGVANLDMPRERINITSSQGPTREGRQKPDIASPGTDIVAANGFAGAGEPWVAMTGTSMASPYVCGVVALMLAARPDLTAAQVNGILQRTATPLPGKNFAWQNDAGFGVINAANCIREAADINQRFDRTRP